MENIAHGGGGARNWEFGKEGGGTREEQGGEERKETESKK